MFGSIILDTAIGLVLVYLFLSLICMTINEAVAAVAGLRAKTLEKALLSMIDNQEIVDKIYNNPVIFGLWKSQPQNQNASTSTPSYKAEAETAAGVENDAKESVSYSAMLRPPSYLPPQQFAHAVLDMLKTDRDMVLKEASELKSAIATLPPGAFQDALQSIYSRVHGDVEEFRTAVETWFDHGMDRVSGWYKRKMQVIGFCVALAVVIICNADTLQIASGLYHDAAMRSTITASAAEYVKTSTQLEMGDLPIGWAYAHAKPCTFLAWCGKAIGWLITAGALTLGAPFWFEVLNKFMNIRLTGRKPGEGK